MLALVAVGIYSALHELALPRDKSSRQSAYFQAGFLEAEYDRAMDELYTLATRSRSKFFHLLAKMYEQISGGTHTRRRAAEDSQMDIANMSESEPEAEGEGRGQGEGEGVEDEDFES
ncbi:hypothetical protein K474DRAFT_1677966 [Panus rudis PR-1116 ss-1]|nr:hypothetical protein K474DRAFT_1677966 [Panus rudis PR-1116 ss-1]